MYNGEEVVEVNNKNVSSVPSQVFLSPVHAINL